MSKRLGRMFETSVPVWSRSVACIPCESGEGRHPASLSAVARLMAGQSPSVGFGTSSQHTTHLVNSWTVLMNLTVFSTLPWDGF